MTVPTTYTYGGGGEQEREVLFTPPPPSYPIHTVVPLDAQEGGLVVADRYTYFVPGILAHYTGDFASETTPASRVIMRTENLSRLDMTGFRVQDSQFWDCTFLYSTLSFVEMPSCFFERCDLTGIICSGDLHETVWQECLLSGTNFTSSNLSYARFLGSDIQRASFCSAMLAQAVFCRCDAKEADFRSANLTGVLFSSPTPSQYNDAYGLDTPLLLQGANFEHAILEETVFDSCDLAGAIFRNTTLTQVSFLDANLTGVNMENVLLEQTRFSSRDQLELADLTALHKTIFYWGLQKRADLLVLQDILTHGKDITEWRRPYNAMETPTIHVQILLRWLGNYDPSVRTPEGYYLPDPATELLIDYSDRILSLQ